MVQLFILIPFLSHFIKILVIPTLIFMKIHQCVRLSRVDVSYARLTDRKLKNFVEEENLHDKITTFWSLT